MRVKAIKLGYYNLKRVRVGQIIDIEDKYFSDKWMERLDGKGGLKAIGSSKKAKAPVEEQEELSQDEEVI